MAVLAALDGWLGDPGTGALLIRAEDGQAEPIATALSAHRYSRKDAPDGWLLFHGGAQATDDAVSFGRSLFDDDAPVDRVARRQDRITQIASLREEVGESLALAFEGRELAVA